MRQVARKGLITIAAAGGVLAAVGGYAHADSGATGGATNSPGVGSGNNVQAPVDVSVNACNNSVDVVGLLNPTFGNECANDGGGKHRGPHGGGHHNRQDQQGQGGRHRGGGHTGGPGTGASGEAVGSPGVASGNNVQAPVDVPVNVCNNTVDVAAVASPTSGNTCGNESAAVPPTGPDYPQHHGGHHSPGAEQPGGPEQPPAADEPSDSGRPSAPGYRNAPGAPETPDAPGMRAQTQTEPRTEIVTTPGAKPAAKAGGQLAQTGAGSIGYAVPVSAGLLLGGAVVYRRARAARR